MILKTDYIELNYTIKIMVDEIYEKFHKQIDSEEGDNEIDGANFVDLNYSYISLVFKQHSKVPRLQRLFSSTSK